MVKPFKMAKAPELFEEVWVVIDVLERLGGELEITAEPRRPRVDHVSSEGVIYGGIDPFQHHRRAISRATDWVVSGECVDDAFQPLIPPCVALTFTRKCERVGQLEE